jgi:hypothetical protein
MRSLLAFLILGASLCSAQFNGNTNTINISGMPKSRLSLIE